MVILASSPLVDSAMRDRAFIALLRRQRRRQTSPYALAHLLRALRPWDRDLSDELWEEIQAILASVHQPSLAAHKQRVLEARRVA